MGNCVASPFNFFSEYQINKQLGKSLFPPKENSNLTFLQPD